MVTSSLLRTALVAVLALTMLAACGGGPAADAQATPTPTAPTTGLPPAGEPQPPAPTPDPVVPGDTAPLPPADPQPGPTTEDGTANAPKTAPPQISGTPSTTTRVGQRYSFRPQASDANGDALTFSIANLPGWATFDRLTGEISGTPGEQNIGGNPDIRITVSDGKYRSSLASFTVTVQPGRKASYGHYIATRSSDTPADVAMLCGKAGVSGVVWRQTWNEIESAPGVYDFTSFDTVLDSISKSANPRCQLWLFIEFKSFRSSPVKNPCPVYLQASHSAPNEYGNGASTCFIWEPVVTQAYLDMLRAAGARYDANPRVEGVIFQESALGLSGDYSQDVAAGGTYTAEAWRDALISLVRGCSAAFPNSRCMAFLNFLRGNQDYLYDVSRAISAVPDNRACMSGPDILPDEPSLFGYSNRVYEVLARHTGCRANSAQNDSYAVTGCGIECIFQFAVSGTYGDFNQLAPLTSGLCVNSYLFWNHRVTISPTGLSWLDALPVIAAHPYGNDWSGRCAGGGGAP